MWKKLGTNGLKNIKYCQVLIITQLKINHYTVLRLNEFINYYLDLYNQL